MRSVLFLLGALFSVFGVVGFVIASVAGMALVVGYEYIGMPLLIIPSAISGIDIAGRVMTNTLCQAIPVTPETLFSAEMLPIWIGCILFLTMESGIYGGLVMIPLGVLHAVRNGNRYYRESWKYDILKRGITLLIVGVVAAIILGLLIRFWYATGVC